MRPKYTLREDGAAPVPVNNASGGNVDGLGAKGDQDVAVKKKKTTLLTRLRSAIKGPR